MTKNIKKPCKECPFTKSSLRGWLSDYTPEQLHTLVMSEINFPCHMTHEDEISFEEAEKYPTCSGALRYMKKAGKLPRRMDLRKKIEEVKEEDLEEILSIPEFIDHHKPFK